MVERGWQSVGGRIGMRRLASLSSICWGLAALLVVVTGCMGCGTDVAQTTSGAGGSGGGGDLMTNEAVNSPDRSALYGRRAVTLGRARLDTVLTDFDSSEVVSLRELMTDLTRGLPNVPLEVINATSGQRRRFLKAFDRRPWNGNYLDLPSKFYNGTPAEWSETAGLLSATRRGQLFCSSPGDRDTHRC